MRICSQDIEEFYLSIQVTNNNEFSDISVDIIYVNKSISKETVAFISRDALIVADEARFLVVKSYTKML